MNLYEFNSSDDIKQLEGATVTKINSEEMDSGAKFLSIDLTSPNGTKHSLGFDGESWFYGNDEWAPSVEEIILVLSELKALIDGCVELGAEDLIPDYREWMDEIIHGGAKTESIIEFCSFINGCTPDDAIDPALRSLIHKALKIETVEEANE